MAQLTILLTACSRALVTHAVAAFSQTVLGLFVPNLPPLACIVLGVLAAVIIVESIALLQRL